MKLFRAKTTIAHADVSRTPSHFTDWYTCETEEEARALCAEDFHRYGIPPSATVVFTECDPVTLKPI